MSRLSCQGILTNTVVSASSDFSLCSCGTTSQFVWGRHVHLQRKILIKNTYTPKSSDKYCRSSLYIPCKMGRKRKPGPGRPAAGSSSKRGKETVENNTIHTRMFSISSRTRSATREALRQSLQDAGEHTSWLTAAATAPDVGARQENTGLQWHYKHDTDTYYVKACHWIDRQHLAVCTRSFVKVYEETTEGSHLAYTLTSDEWKEKFVIGVAVSESMPNSILAIIGKPYVYQYPRHEATRQVKKFKIHDNEVTPWCIAANDNTAVVAFCSAEGNPLVVCSLPDFTHQSHIQTSVEACDLSMTTDYLLVMGRSEMLVKPMSDLSQELCRIQPSDGIFHSISFRNNARQIYAVCGQDNDQCCVYKYTWDGIGKPQYVNTGCVIDGLRKMGFRCLSVTSDGLLAVREGFIQSVKVYILE